ncbi:unnamed protein product [Paramecium octaurelia]|uniref:Uncharacterized protein n=1 Tax=Paramecium octaurelia TaxID=43137 RepID=A0A8S1VPL9_PAROT|nr:unnamed protein product [Paramecium octaurelia]
MSAAKFMNILAQRDQQYLENPQFNSYQQFKQAIQTLGFQQTQSTIMKFKNQCTPPTSDNSPYFFSKQEQWQKNQDLLAQQVNSSSTKSYRAIYPNKKLTSLEERYQQHNSQSSFMNKVLSSEPSPLLQYKSQSPSLKDKDQSEMSQIQQQMSHPILKKSNLKIKVDEAGRIKKKKTVQIVEIQLERGNQKEGQKKSPKKIITKTEIRTVQDFLVENSSKKTK